MGIPAVAAIACGAPQGLEVEARENFHRCVCPLTPVAASMIRVSSSGDTVGFSSPVNEMVAAFITGTPHGDDVVARVVVNSW